MNIENYVKKLPKLVKKVDCLNYIVNINDIKLENNRLKLFYEFSNGNIIERDVEFKVPFKPEIAVDHFDDLPPNADYPEFTVAYVDESQGSKWKFNYKPDGFYLNIDGFWYHDDKQVYKALDNILTSLDSKKNLSPFTDTASIYILGANRSTEIHIHGSNFDKDTTFRVSDTVLIIEQTNVVSNTHAILFVKASGVLISGFQKVYHEISAKNSDATSPIPVSIVSANNTTVLIPAKTSKNPLEVWKVGSVSGVTVGTGTFKSDGNNNWNKKAYFGRVDVNESCQLEFKYDGHETEGFGVVGFETKASGATYRNLENSIYIRGITIRIIEDDNIVHTFLPDNVYGTYRIVRLKNADNSIVNVYYIVNDKVIYISKNPVKTKFVVYFFSQKNSEFSNINLSIV